MLSMKRQNVKAPETTTYPKKTEMTMEEIDQTLRRIHKKMSQIFQIDFAYFGSIKIIKSPEIQNALAQRIRSDLEKNGVPNNSTQWNQTFETLSENSATEILETFAYYNPQEDKLYINEKMLATPPEKIVSVFAHEIAEKLFSTFALSSKKSCKQHVASLYFENTKANNTEKLQEIRKIYIDIVLKTFFKESYCEAIGLKTLCYMGFESEVASLEKELQEGYNKCVGLLSYIEKKITIIEIHSETTDSKQLTAEVLKSFQIIKGVAYYLGYPLAKTVLENYGIEGITFLLQNNPPLKAQYFADPKKYLTLLKKNKHV
jgi:hypothetical protein